MSSATLIDVNPQLHPSSPARASCISSTSLQAFPPVVIKQEPIHLTEEDFRESLRNTWLPDIDTNVAVNLVASTNSAEQSNCTSDIIKKEYSSFLDGTTSFHDLDKNQAVLTCSVCHERFYDSISLTDHQKSCLPVPVKSFLCGTCNKVFSAKSRLNNHTRIHTGIKPYSCSVCAKAFADKSAYTKHEKIHFRLKEEKVECNLCGGLFSDAWGLKKHQLTHSGERPYECPICHKTFRTSSTLVVHKRIHTGEKPYPCTMCDKRFTVKTHLVTHSRTHSGERPYECTTCGRAFSDRSSWRRHSRRHTTPTDTTEPKKQTTSAIESLQHFVTEQCQKTTPNKTETSFTKTTQPFFENFHRFILEHHQLLDESQRFIPKADESGDGSKHFKLEIKDEVTKNTYLTENEFRNTSSTYPYFVENQTEKYETSNEFQKYKSKSNLGSSPFFSIYNAAVPQQTPLNFMEDLNSRNQM